jgi:hypothetical protein
MAHTRLWKARVTVRRHAQRDALDQRRRHRATHPP